MTDRLTLRQKVQLAARIWTSAGRILINLRRHPLPDVVGSIDENAPAMSSIEIPPQALGRIIVRALTLGPFTARCLTRSLVLYEFLVASGYTPTIAIGVDTEDTTTDAHAWIELGQHDVGPPPGRGNHSVLARYPTRQANMDMKE